MKKDRLASFREILTTLEKHPPAWACQEKRIEAFLALGHLFETSIRPGQMEVSKR